MKILLIVIAIILLCIFVVYIAKLINYFRISSLQTAIIIFWIVCAGFIIGMFTSIFLIDSKTNKADTVYILK